MEFAPWFQARCKSLSHSYVASDQLSLESDDLFTNHNPPNFQPRPIKTESNSDDSSSPSPQPRMTLSERFGRMAQWSIDRDLEHHRNLKITSGDQFTVEMDSPPSPFPG